MNKMQAALERAETQALAAIPFVSINRLGAAQLRAHWKVQEAGAAQLAIAGRVQRRMQRIAYHAGINYLLMQ